jgi:transcription elongation factor GreA
VLSARAADRQADDVLITQDGYDRLCRELQTLTTTGRHELEQRLREARADGGDAALTDALEQHVLLEQRIRALQERLAGARVVEPGSAGGAARVGTRVGVRTSEGDVHHYALVGAGEADPARGHISIASPVGKAIMGRRAGEQVEVETPRRRATFELVSVEPLDSGLAKAA